MLLKNLGILRCPLDFSLLNLDKNRADIIDGYVLDGELFCQEKSHRFLIKNGVPHLIPEQIQNLLDLEKKFLKIFRKRKVLGRTLKISPIEAYIVQQIKAMDIMAKKYREYVADVLGSSPFSARSYEQYEDLLIGEVMEEYIGKAKKDKSGVIFIEVGSGPGRYLIQFGAKISPKPTACRKYRIHADLGYFYSYSSKYADYLKLIIGIDFSEEMIKSALMWLRENALDDLFYRDRIMMVRGIAQHRFLTFNSTPYEKCYKIVTCMFQTLGNQLDRILQIEMIRRMKELAEPHGIILVSVFNKATFDDYLHTYYEAITPAIGPIISSSEDLKEATLRTKWGIYSRWFNEEELRELFIEASKDPSFSKLADVEILSGDRLPLYPQHARYLDLRMQEEVRRRAIIAKVVV